MKTVGKRREREMTTFATGALLAEGARFSESISYLAKPTYVPKGVYRFKSHEAANRHAQDCLVSGMGRLAAERVSRPILLHMPTVLRILGFRFHFYSDEGTEPPHIHVATSDGECKFWLSPVLLAKNRGISAVDIRKVERLVYEHQTLLLEKYDDFQSE